MLSTQLPQCDGNFMLPQEHHIHIQQRNDAPFHNIACSFIVCKLYFNYGNQTQGNLRCRNIPLSHDLKYRSNTRIFSGPNVFLHISF